MVFGVEPTDAQLYEFILKNFFSLSFRKSTSQNALMQKEIGYKRMQRKIKKTIRRIKIFLETKEEKRKTQSSLILIYMQ